MEYRKQILVKLARIFGNDSFFCWFHIIVFAIWQYDKTSWMSIFELIQPGLNQTPQQYKILYKGNCLLTVYTLLNIS